MEKIEALEKLESMLFDIKSELKRFKEYRNSIDSPWIDINQASTYLKISVSKIHKLTSRGEIPFKRVGKGTRSKLLFSKKQLDLWIITGKTRGFTKRERESLETWI